MTTSIKAKLYEIINISKMKVEKRNSKKKTKHESTKKNTNPHGTFLKYYLCLLQPDNSDFYLKSCREIDVSNFYTSAFCNLTERPTYKIFIKMYTFKS